jgi:hypothetical protein
MGWVRIRLLVGECKGNEAGKQKKGGKQGKVWEKAKPGVSYGNISVSKNVKKHVRGCTVAAA